MTEKRKRRWYQFSLRALLLAVLVVSLPLSWFAVRMERARRQKEAVEAIRKAGGQVFYDYEVECPFRDPLAETSIPKWARALLGDDFFFDADRVAVDGNFGDAEASHLKALTHLTYLALSYTQVTDAGLEHLNGLANLQWLNLSRTRVTDAGLEHLKGLTKLGWLHLKDTQVTDAGVNKLKKALPNCFILHSLTRVPLLQSPRSWP